MNFVKSKKNVNENNSNDQKDKRRDRQQRSESARLFLQSPRSKSKVDQTSADDSSYVMKNNAKLPYSKSASADTFMPRTVDKEFRPEELPDGVCYRPQKDLNNLPQSGSPAHMSKGNNAASNGTDNINSKPKTVVASPPPEMTSEQVRLAEYVGTFSVSGCDKEARERQMEQQLVEMRSVTNTRPVKLHISGAGVKVVLQENQCVFMDHSLKRIWYATCDPDSCQFSFLAREPKTSAEVQYCHAFNTTTPEQAEELITIIGQAFKSSSPSGTVTADKPEPTPTPPSRQPTFHEIIEQQVQQQQAKYREKEEEAKTVLQQKLQQIATPTPFSETAQHRMEQRRQSDEMESERNQGRLWAKDLVERRRISHAMSPDRNNLAANRRSEIPTRQITPQTSPFKRNSVPVQVSSSSVNNTNVHASPSPHPLSAMAIKEHMEKKSNGKQKGSPVTALKNEIDRRLAMSNGVDTYIPPPPSLEEEKARLIQQHQALANRPLPLPPDNQQSPVKCRNKPHQTNGEVRQRRPDSSPHHSQSPRHQRSLDDHNLPRSATSQIPLSSSSNDSKQNSAASNVKLRDSPRRHQPRPMSEIAVSSSGVGVNGNGGSRYYEQQRQSLLNNFAASFLGSPPPEGADNGMFIYGPSPTRTENRVQEEAALYELEHEHQQQRGRDFQRRSQGECILGNGKTSDSSQYYGIPETNMLNSHLFGNHRSQSGDRRGGGEPVVPRYQNDSPFQKEPQKPTPGQSQRLESLMCLDRSHIHDDKLRETTWYQAGLPRDLAMEILQQEEIGSFLVRDSSTHPGCYVLSVRVPKYENPAEVSHYLILRTQRGVKLKGLDKEWSTLPALVTHHTVMREMLPCTLRLPKVKASADSQKPGTGDDEYHELSEVSGLVGKLKM